MEESLVHVFDYNLAAIFALMKHYVKTGNWFRYKPWLVLVAVVMTVSWIQIHAVKAQDQATPTETPTPGGPAPIVTNTYTEAVNVRSGPNSLYPQVGSLPVGATAQALAVSPAHEWIEIAFPSAPDGVGWVYAPFVQLSPGFLRVVEPPPTSTPLATATFDPTLAAAFQAQPTSTRLPTFTPPPPLDVPTFAAPVRPAAGFPTGVMIVGLAFLGGLVWAASALTRR